MMDYIVSIGVWNWFIAGALLLAIEIAAPGAFMMWLGLAALIVGGKSVFVEWTWQAHEAAGIGHAPMLTEPEPKAAILEFLARAP